MFESCRVYHLFLEEPDGSFFILWFGFTIVFRQTVTDSEKVHVLQYTRIKMTGGTITPEQICYGIGNVHSSG